MGNNSDIRICCSTGTFLGRPNGRDYKLFGSYAPSVKCDAFELMFFANWYGDVDAVIEYLRGTGFRFCSLHAEKGIGDDFSQPDAATRRDALRRFEINCKVAAAIGAKTVVLHLWGPPFSDTCIRRNFAVYPEVGRIANAAGVTVAIENIICTRGAPLQRLLQIAHRYPDAKFTYDTRMAAFHAEFDDMYGKRADSLWQNGNIAHVHYSDYAGGYKQWERVRVILHPGEGQADVSRLADRLHSAGYGGVVVLESPVLSADGFADIAKLNASLDYLRRVINGTPV